MEDNPYKAPERNAMQPRRFAPWLKQWQLSVVASVAVGAFVWFASPRLFGEREPWDADWRYHLYLLVTGILGGAIFPRSWWIWPLGVWVGQTVGFCSLFISQPVAPLAPMGFAVFLPLTSVVSFAGAILGVVGRKLAGTLRGHL